jgi:hypothetical protein
MRRTRSPCCVGARAAMPPRRRVSRRIRSVDGNAHWPSWEAVTRVTLSAEQIIERRSATAKGLTTLTITLWHQTSLDRALNLRRHPVQGTASLRPSPGLGGASRRGTGTG